MTIYEVNQIAYDKLPNMSEAAINQGIKDIEDYLVNHNAKYYIMLNHECRYYTVYTYKEGHNINKMAEEIIDTVKTLGVLKGIEVYGEMIEFWIKTEDGCFMYAFFDYDRGVIEI